jgi:hypothetical protein
MVDGLPRLTDGLGEGVFLVKLAPTAAVIQFDEVTQRPARTKQLTLGVLALDGGGQRLGHVGQSDGKT